MKITAYQTLEDRNNPQHVEDYGPFPCSRKNAWLGFGYYFWDTFIDLAHWWGSKCPEYNNAYIVCQAKLFKDETLWDLQGDGSHLMEFEGICLEIIDSGISASNRLLVPQVIEYFKRKGKFNYKAIRALGVRSINAWEPIVIEVLNVSFSRGSVAYLEMRPAVQICLLEKSALSLQGFQIVYPPEYVEAYA